MQSFLGLLAMCAVLSPLASQDASKKDGKKDELAQQVIKLTNEERAKQKRAALRPNELLMKAARQHAEGLAKKNNPNEAADGKAALERVRALGFRFSAAGENVAFGHHTPEEVIALWLGSNIHRDNLLSSRFTQIGVATAKSTDGTLYFVALVAAPARR